MAYDKLTLELRWYHQFQFAGYYAAQKQGFFKDEGLDVTIEEGRPGTSQTDLILAEPGRIGISSSGLVIQYAKGVPIVILEPVFQHAADVLISLESSGIRMPSDLIGKTVMDRAFKKDPFPGYRGMLSSEGLDPERVHWIENTWNIDDLIRGKADAMSGYITTQVPEFRKRKIPIHTMSPLDYGIDLYGDILFTSTTTAKKYPDALRRFMRATAKGWVYAFEHTNETIDQILAMPSGRAYALPRDLLEGEAKEMRRIVEPDLIPIGYSNPGRWERIIDLYKKLGALPPGDLRTDDLFFPDETRERQLLVERLLKVLSALVILGSFAAIWILQLRTQVTKKTHAVQEAMKKAEDQKQIAERSNEVKSLFLANMSHEIRTPLTAILGFSELLKSDELSQDERLHFLSVIERTGQSLSTILSDILDLSKIDAEKFEVRFAPLSLRALVSDVREVLDLRAKAKRINLVVRLDEDVPDRIHTDGIRLKQILLNIIGNAVKFTERGSVEVQVSRTGVDQIDFLVTDTGPGIDDAEKSRLFQAFTQVDPSVSRVHGGTGLGLSLSRKLARLLGGDVILEASTKGKGSVFRVQIAYAEVGGSVKIPESRERSTKNAELRGQYILVVDDCIDNQVLVRLFLEKAGARVAIAGDGLEAIELVQQETFALILMDIQMPNMDGYVATKKIRELRYSGPIIALTANAMRDDVDRSMQAGCDAYLAKPVKRQELLDTVIRYLRPAPRVQA